MSPYKKLKLINEDFKFKLLNINQYNEITLPKYLSINLEFPSHYFPSILSNIPIFKRLPPEIIEYICHFLPNITRYSPLTLLTLNNSLVISRSTSDTDKYYQNVVNFIEDMDYSSQLNCKREIINKSIKGLVRVLLDKRLYERGSLCYRIIGQHFGFGIYYVYSNYCYYDCHDDYDIGCDINYLDDYPAIVYINNFQSNINQEWFYNNFSKIVLKINQIKKRNLKMDDVIGFCNQINDGNTIFQNFKKYQIQFINNEYFKVLNKSFNFLKKLSNGKKTSRDLIKLSIKTQFLEKHAKRKIISSKPSTKTKLHKSIKTPLRKYQKNFNQNYSNKTIKNHHKHKHR